MPLTQLNDGGNWYHPANTSTHGVTDGRDGTQPIGNNHNTTRLTGAYYFPAGFGHVGIQNAGACLKVRFKAHFPFPLVMFVVFKQALRDQKRHQVLVFGFRWKRCS